MAGEFAPAPFTPMNLTADPLPLRQDEDGVVWISGPGTRVLLELVVNEHNAGATPEQIVERYDSLELADVYAVIAFYLRHKQVVDEYVRREEEACERMRQFWEAKNPPQVSREELLARWGAFQAKRDAQITH